MHENLFVNFANTCTEKKKEILTSMSVENKIDYHYKKEQPGEQNFKIFQTIIFQTFHFGI